MPPPRHENDPPPPRKNSWWNPSRGSWRSPWSMDGDEDLGPPPQPVEPSVPKKKKRRVDTPSTPVLERVLHTTIAPKVQPTADAQVIAARVTTPAENRAPAPEPPVIEPPKVVTAPSAPPAVHVPAAELNVVAAPPAAAPVVENATALQLPPLESAPPPAAPQPIRQTLQIEQMPPLIEAGAAVMEPSAPAMPSMPALPPIEPASVVSLEPKPPAPPSTPSEDAEEVVFRRFKTRSMNPPMGAAVNHHPAPPPVPPPPAAPAPVVVAAPPSLGPTAPRVITIAPHDDAPPFAPPPEAAPVFRSRRIVPPRARPPGEESEAPPPSRVMANPPPEEVVFKTEPAPSPSPLSRRNGISPAARRDEDLSKLDDVPPFEPDLPPQVGEWPPRRPRPAETGPWRMLMIVALFAFAFTITAWIYWQDDRMPSEETLQLQRDFDENGRPPAINRMRTLLTSVAPVQKAAQVGVPPWNWEQPELARMVESNGVARENLRDLLAEGDWHPGHKAWFEEDIGAHGAWMTLSILKQAEAAYLMSRGEEEAAFSAALDLAELARSLQQLHAWPSYYERSFQIFERACQSLVVLLQATKKLDQKKLAELQDEFARCAPSDQVLQSAMSAWYLFEKKLMMGPESREPLETLPGGILYQRPGRLFFKPNRTLELFVRTFQELRDEAEKSPYSRSSQAGARVNRRGPGFGMPNSAGQAWFATRVAPYLEIPDRQSIAHAQHAVTLTLFAIRRFAVDWHRLPPKLLNLRPDYLKDTPSDPFSGEPLKYDGITGIVSSVGTNFTLDPGKPADPPFSDPREISAQAGMVK